MQSQTATQRQIIVITGDFSTGSKLALRLCLNLRTLNLENPKQAHQYLGQEFDAVIFNSHALSASSMSDKQLFDTNAFGAVTGTIRAGGYLILLKPEKWSRHSLFLQRFDRLLKQFYNLRLIDTSSVSLPQITPLAPLAQRQTQTTQDQYRAIEAIIKVVKGHRRRPLIISADRGRGKSAALGLAASQLYQQGCETIIVCAPSKKNAAVVFQYAENIPLLFYSPDNLQRDKPPANLVLIDEAAAIPVPILSDLVKHYSRIVFATTQHGYEGSGRGFTLRFQKVLNAVAPQWKSCKLSIPIRWDNNDPVEQFVYQALLLNAEAVDAALITSAKLENCQFELVAKNELVNNESQLITLFGLLVSAHYQTRPSDFRQMLDDESVSVFILRYQHHIIGVSLIAKEGGIDRDLAKAIFAGTRRIKGHLVAQALAANIGLQDAACRHGRRILRIAIHPVLQQQGFGSHLLKQLFHYYQTQDQAQNQTQAIQEKERLDYFSVSFGATTSLIHFWQKATFTPVYLSIKRDASSGTHSLIMLHAISQTAIKMQTRARQLFIQSFPHMLSDPFRMLESDIVFELLQDSTELQLSKNDLAILTAFLKSKRGFENSYYPIWKLVLTKFAHSSNLSQPEKKIIILKVLQKKSWERCRHELKNNPTNHPNILNLLRICTAKLLDQ